MAIAEEHKSSTGKYVGVYICLLVIAALQFVVAYSGAGASQMLAFMLALAVIESGLAAMFFMHLGSEKRSLLAFVGIITTFVLLALQYGWTDSYRLLSGAPWAK